MRILDPLIGLLLLAAAAPAAGSAMAQQRGLSWQTAAGADLVARDGRIAFDRRSATFARVDLDELEPGDHGRIAALVALGAAHSVTARALLVAETARSGRPAERSAAAFALGELGPNVGTAVETLIQLTADEDPMLARAAMVALVRSGVPAGRSRVARIASGSDELAAEARSILAHQADPTRSNPPESCRRLYAARWDAARSYGLVDGKIWGSSLLAEISSDTVFLEELVLRLTRDLDLDNAKDHLLEILFEGKGPARIRTATSMMPFELEALIDAGVWLPASAREWKWLVQTVVNEELQARYPRTLALSMEQPLTRALAAGLLQGGDERYEDILQQAFESNVLGERADAAFAVGVANATVFIPRLNDLCEGELAWTRVNAIASLIRMGSHSGVERAIDIFATPPEEREPRLSSYLFEVLSRAAPDPQILQFLGQISTSLTGPDRAAVDSILLLSDVIVDTTILRRELPLMIPTTWEARRGVRALGRRPSAKDAKLLARLFPREGARGTNLELAAALARASHRSAEPLLQAAVWELDFDLSILAAGVVRQTYGPRTLIAWAISPPADVTDQDVCRLGFAIGAWGGMPAVEELRKQLGTTAGAELPALQGAVLGALAARTR